MTGTATNSPRAEVSRPLRIAITADLHWGTRHSTGRQATEDMAAYLTKDPPDVLILAGDIGVADDFAACLALFGPVNATKALVPGNHDLWVTETDARGDSLRVFRDTLPRIAQDHGFQYLDRGPLVVMESDLAIVGTVNWYDYSWAKDELPALSNDWEERLHTKRFTRGRHNDANFVRWPLDDSGFTREVVGQFEKHIHEALNLVGHALVVTHHPPVRGLNFPQIGPRTLDGALWLAFSGNASLEGILHQHQNQIPAIFCGHTHKAMHCHIGPTCGYNIGGDYNWKRLLMYDWPLGTTTAITFPGDGSHKGELPS